jgi:hypothetical protein
MNPGFRRCAFPNSTCAVTPSGGELQAVEDVLGAAGGSPGTWKSALGDYWKERLSAADVSIKALQVTAEETLRVIDATIAVQKTIAGSVAQLELLLKQQQDLLKVG